ncbi:MAG: hypothetical protein WB711_19170 [Terriglobales bacterium]
MPEQQRSVTAVEDGLRQFSEPLRPQAKAAPPHRYYFRIGINGLCRRSNHPGRYPRGGILALLGGSVVESDTQAGSGRAPCQKPA